MAEPVQSPCHKWRWEIWKAIPGRDFIGVERSLAYLHSLQMRGRKGDPRRLPIQMEVVFQRQDPSHSPFEACWASETHWLTAGYWNKAVTKFLRALDFCPLETQMGASMNKETSVCFLLENYKLPLMAKMKRELSEARTVTEGISGALMRSHTSRQPIIPEDPSSKRLWYAPLGDRVGKGVSRDHLESWRTALCEGAHRVIWRTHSTSHLDTTFTCLPHWRVWWPVRSNCKRTTNRTN